MPFGGWNVDTDCFRYETSLGRMIEQTSVEEDEFQLPMMNQPLHTTEFYKCTASVEIPFWDG